MPKGKHVRGVGNKEQRQYEHIVESAKKSGRYGKRAKEVAARTVLKHHKKKGHSKGHWGKTNMLSHCNYDKTKLIFELSKLIGFLDKHAIQDSKNEEHGGCTATYQELKLDLDKHLHALTHEMTATAKQGTYVAEFSDQPEVVNMSKGSSPHIKHNIAEHAES